MRIFKNFKNIMLQADLFSSNEILKYKSDTQYKTILGSIISLGIIVALCIGFSNMIGSALEKSKIESKLQVKKQLISRQLNLSIHNNNFMIGMFIHSMDYTKYFDLLNGPQIFDYSTASLEIQNGMLSKYVPFALQNCNKQHWKMIPSVYENFGSSNMGQWLCPRANQSFILKGLSTNQLYKSIVIQINTCKNTSYNGNKCAPQSVIDQTFANYTNFYLRTAYSNPVINQNQPNAVQYYLQDRSALIFSKTIGNNMVVKFSQYKIETDESILPYTSIQNQEGYIIDDSYQRIAFTIDNKTPLARIILNKSTDLFLYTREVLKISAVFSYIGGLIGALITAFIMIKSYTETSLQINLSLDLFKKQPQDSQQTQVQNKKLTFNFFDYLSFILYKFFKLCNKTDRFKIGPQLQKYQDQIEKQLDIKIILQRIIKIQSCMSYLFDSDDIEGIKNSQQITCKRARQLRTLLFKTDQIQPQQAREAEIIPQKIKQKGQQHKAYDLSAQSSINVEMNTLSRFNPKKYKNQINKDKNKPNQDPIFKMEGQLKINDTLIAPNSLQKLKNLRQKSESSLIKKKILQDLQRQYRKSLDNMIQQLQIPNAVLIERKINQ